MGNESIRSAYMRDARNKYDNRAYGIRNLEPLFMLKWPRGGAIRSQIQT